VAWASTPGGTSPPTRPANTFHLRGLFILRKLGEHDSTTFHDVMTDLYRNDQPDPQDIGAFEWQTILAFMGASEEEIKDVQKRMGPVWR
jgi:hypothetical protein